MQKDFQDMFREARDAYNKLTTYCAQLGPVIQNTADAGELADMAYALRETEKLLEETRRRVTAVQSLAEKMACLVTISIMDGECIRTNYCTAIPRARTNVSIPSRRKDFAGWSALMTHIGIPKELQGSHEEDASAAVDVHWPGLMAYLAKEQEAGRPLPPGIDPNRSITDYSLTIRKKKGVTE